MRARRWENEPGARRGTGRRGKISAKRSVRTGQDPTWDPDLARGVGEAGADRKLGDSLADRGGDWLGSETKCPCVGPDKDTAEAWRPLQQEAESTDRSNSG